MFSKVSAQQTNRLIGIDVGRFFSIIGVILIHSAGSGRFLNAANINSPVQFGIDAGVIIEQISRFAVPFFFCASGYFLARQNTSPITDVLSRIAKRLIPAYFVWSLFYVLITSKRMLWLSNPDYMLEWLVNGGPGFHLWFLPSLAVNMALVAYLKRHFSWNTLFVFAGILYVSGLALGSYLPLIIQNPDPVFNVIARDLPCFGFVFVVCGMYTASSPPRNSEQR